MAELDDEEKTHEAHKLLRRAKLLRELAELAETHSSSFNGEVKERAELLRRIADVYEKLWG